MSRAILLLTFFVIAAFSVALYFQFGSRSWDSSTKNNSSSQHLRDDEVASVGNATRRVASKSSATPVNFIPQDQVLSGPLSSLHLRERSLVSQFVADSTCATAFVNLTTFMINSEFGVRHCIDSTAIAAAAQAATTTTTATTIPNTSSSSSSSSSSRRLVLPLQMPTCPIDVHRPLARPIYSVDGSTRNRVARKLCAPDGTVRDGVCSKSFPLAIVGTLYRPAHAMQFLFSLMGLVALQSETGLYRDDVPFFVSVTRYGAVDTQAHFCRAKFPHLELLDLLTPDPSGVFLFHDAAWKDYTLKVSDFRVQQQQPLSAACRDVDASTAKQRKALGAVYCVEQQLVAGSIPVRIPGKSPPFFPDPRIRPEHFQDFRQRILSRWLPEFVESSASFSGPDSYILLVQRGAGKGRKILNERRLSGLLQQSFAALDLKRQQQNFSSSSSVGGTTTTAVGAADDSPNIAQPSPSQFPRVRVVEWERMKLVDQLRLVVGARAMVGAHGNGLWLACFMQRDSLIIEFSSSLPMRNEVFEGVNRQNAGQIASSCGMRALSLRSRWVESSQSDPHSENPAPEHRRWKAVDIAPGRREFAAIERFVLSGGVEF